MAIGYKLFRVKKSEKGKLYPLYVLADKETPINKWLEAEVGEMKENGKVKSRLGDLAFRAGWHLTDTPYETHIGEKVDGKITFLPENLVWCEVEYDDRHDYQSEVNANGIRNGKLVPKFAMMKEIPVGGFYKYKTNPNMFGSWIISGAIKVNRVLSDNEVLQICKSKGLKPLPRKIPFDFKGHGFEVK